MLSYIELVKTIYVPLSEVHDCATDFKIEILKHPDGTFSAQLFRQEHYSLKPSFEAEEIIADEIVCVPDSYSIRDWPEKRYDSAEQCIRQSLEVLENFFSFK
ncbi:hypothetical protein [Neisseria weaveri]|uniref:hypothetical protein n=1 Tax=Neisseria weaveri TaxID=28091 RepID=UPI000D2F809F|nr:hypothetical protein [Neisseria weaveri]